MSITTKPVYIVAARRTPIGRFLGALKNVPAPALGATAIRAALGSAGVAPTAVDEVIFGEVLTAGVGQAPARQAAIAAGIPHSVPALTIGKVCGSGLKAVMLGAQQILLDEADVVVTGGQESMSNAPYIFREAREGARMGNKEMADSMILDGLWDPYDNVHMGSCGELCARELKISREEQDAFARTSYERAREAIAKGYFKEEIAAVEVKAGKTQTLVDTDEEPQASDLAKMPSLKPVFDKAGTITAANASSINDGAACVVLASEKAVKAQGLKPLARVVAWSTHAQEPKWFTTAPVDAIKKVIAKAGLASVRDIDLFEINEAFSVVTLAAIKALELDPARVNVHGGAVSLGHPIGASGARILTTLAHALRQQGKKRGLATLCIGGGEAVAVVIERV